MPRTDYTERDVREMLRKAVERTSQAVMAAEIGIVQQTISDIIRAKKGVSPSVAKYFGLEPVKVFRKKK